MHSSNVSSSATSVRRSSSAFTATLRKRLARLHLERRPLPREDARRRRSAERGRAPLDADPTTLPEADDRRVVLFEELEDPLLLRLAHVHRCRIRIEVMRADLEIDQRQRFEGFAAGRWACPWFVFSVGPATMDPALEPT